ncbi:MAG: DUF2141 domain-containing protein [Calothrix sp. SM1_5_4]|nr:DUF2141 domain-containing protein [Calothrix sp. SM1_5_4]
MLLIFDPVHAAELEVSGLRSGDGHLAVSVFADAGGFPGDAGQAATTYYIPLEGRRVVDFTIENLPEGAYAIAILHDEDSDKKLRSFLGIPREGFGFSNNPLIVAGPPSFGKARVELSPGAKIAIRMKYML